MAYLIHQDQPAGLPLANLDELNDTNISSPANKDVLSYDATSQKWINDSSINSALTDLQQYRPSTLYTATSSTFVAQTSVNVDLKNYTLFEAIMYVDAIGSSSRFSCMFTRSDIAAAVHTPLGQNMVFRPTDYRNGVLSFGSTSNVMILSIIGLL